MADIRFSALVPMKGHSERVKNKNLRDFDGKPLFWHILNTLGKCSFISGIYVDTDSEEIASQVKKYFAGAEIIVRPAVLCGDMVSMNDIIKYDMSVVNDEYYIQTHSTNPLLKAETLNSACAEFIRNADSYDSAFSVTRLQTRLYDQYGNAVNHDPANLIRTQDLPPIFEENSNFYIFSRESFMKKNARIGEKPMMVEVPAMEAADIDEESDFVIAEQIHKILF